MGSLARSSDGSLQRVGERASTTVRISGDELLSVAEDAVLGDVKTVELLLRFDPQANGRFERRKDRVGGYKSKCSGCDDTQGLDAKLVEAPCVEEAALAGPHRLRQRGGGKEPARKRAPDPPHTVGRDGS